jgi:hypothetical protein
MKLVTNVPSPKPPTPEESEAMEAEAREWRIALKKRIRAMENITAEDLKTILK